MSALPSLPTELVTRILRFLSKADIASLRLVNKHIDPIAAAALFEEVTLYAHWYSDYGTYYPESWSQNFDYDAAFFKNILDHKLLHEHPRRVTIYTCEKHCDHNPFDFNGKITPAGFEPVWEDCFDRICEFPNVRGVTLCFDRHATEDYQFSEVLMGPSDRQEHITKLLRSLRGRIRELSIRNYNGHKHARDEEVSEEEKESEDPTLLPDTLRNLTSFRLSVIHDEFGEPRYRLRDGDPHTFWHMFPDTFLKPMEHSLKHLTLYSDIPLGWFPKLDLRNVHFPRLKSLALGQIIFSHDWQVDWIISHKATLEDLYLDHCSILHVKAFAIVDWLDDDGYPRFDSSLVNEDGDSGWGLSVSTFHVDDVDDFQPFVRFIPYSTRWYEVFARFSESLTHLREFRFGTSKQWDFHASSQFDSRHFGLQPLPIMPWQDETTIVNRLFHQRYLHYDDWKQAYESDFDWDNQYQYFWEESWEDQLARPDAEVDIEDERALRVLTSKLPNHFMNTTAGDVAAPKDVRETL